MLSAKKASELSRKNLEQITDKKTNEMLKEFNNKLLRATENGLFELEMAIDRKDTQYTQMISDKFGKILKKNGYRTSNKYTNAGGVVYPFLVIQWDI